MGINSATTWRDPLAERQTRRGSSLAEMTAGGDHADELTRQRDKLETIGLMTGYVVHDLNNLLQAIATRVEMMRTRGATEAGIDAILDVVATAGTAIEDLSVFLRK